MKLGFSLTILIMAFSERKCSKARRFCLRSSWALRSLHGRAQPAS